MNNGLKIVGALLALNAAALGVHGDFLLAFCWVVVLAFAVMAIMLFKMLWAVVNVKSFEVPKTLLAVVLVCTCIFGWTCMKISKDCDGELVCEVKAPWVKWNESPVSKKYMELVEDEERCTEMER